MSAFDKLRKTAEKTKPKSKSVVEIKNPEMEEACDKLVSSSRDFKNAEASLKRDQSIILDYIREAFAQAMEDGTPSKSFRINDKVLCTFTDRFTAPTEQDLQELQATLTVEQFNKFFKQKATVKLKDTIATNEDKLNELIDLLGDNAERFFDIGVSYTTTDGLDTLLASEGCYDEVRDVIERLRYRPTIRIA